MQDIIHQKGKVYYSMGEVAEMFDVNPSLLRYWEKEFDVLKPHRNKKGNRLFTPQDVDYIKVIYHLLKEKKMKIEVARKHIKDNKKEADRDAVIVERLMSIRSMLQQIKQDMLHGAADDENDDPAEDVAEANVIITTGETAGHVKPGKATAQAEASPIPTAESTPPVPDTVETELTITEILAQETDAEKRPFREQMLFEVTEAGVPSLDSMINSFLAKNFNSGTDDPQSVEYDPFALFAGGDDTAGDAESATAEVEKPRPAVIEQTLF